MANLLQVKGWLVSFALVLSGSAACTVQSAAKGEACARSAQCVPGLVCVAGKCGSDLTSIAKGNTVPNLGLGTDAAAADGGDASADGASKAAGEAGVTDAAGSDAASSAQDAAGHPMPHDAATPDAAAPAGDS